jgi:hypothetical protein
LNGNTVAQAEQLFIQNSISLHRAHIRGLLLVVPQGWKDTNRKDVQA